MLANDQIGFVLLVDDWMRFSTQLTSLLGNWRASRQQRPPGPGFGASDLLSD
jgi:extradiol dioxygenase family protein